jgi:hypothetical protein
MLFQKSRARFLSVKKNVLLQPKSLPNKVSVFSGGLLRDIMLLITEALADVSGLFTYEPFGSGFSGEWSRLTVTCIFCHHIATQSVEWSL